MVTHGYITPVMYTDTSGEFAVVNTESAKYMRIILHSLFIRISKPYNAIKHDISGFDLNNTDETIVLESNYFSFYKGSLVIRHSIPNTTSCAIFYTIFLNKNENKITTVQHEWGHTQQERMLGTPMYISRVVIPSVYGYFNTPYNEYYSQPWEYTADVLGGVNRNGYGYSISIEKAMEYLSWGRRLPITLPVFTYR